MASTWASSCSPRGVVTQIGTSVSLEWPGGPALWDTTDRSSRGTEVITFEEEVGWRPFFGSGPRSTCSRSDGRRPTDQRWSSAARRLHLPGAANNGVTLYGGETEQIVFIFERAAPEAETSLRVASYKSP